MRKDALAWNVKLNTTPKLPPPPRSAQNRSGCSLQETDAAIQREAAHAGRRIVAERDAQPVRPARVVHGTQQAAAAHLGDALLRVHLDDVEALQVDNERVVLHGVMGVAPARHGQAQTFGLKI